jgi:O-antigen/teichoic acid export membrane protein
MARLQNSESATRKLLSSGIVRNIISIGLGDFIAKLITFFVFAYVARVLSPTYFGILTFAAALVGFFLPFVDYGFGFIGTREVSRNAQVLTRFVKNVVLIRLILAVLSFSLLIVITFLVGFSDIERTVVLLYGLGFLPAAFLLAWAYQAVGKTGWFVVEKLVQALLYAVGVLLLVKGTEDLALVPLLAFVSSLFGVVFVILGFLPRRWEKSPPVDFSFCGSLLRSAFPLFLSLFLVQISASFSTTLLGFLSSKEEVGYFSAAFKVILVVAILPNLLWSSFYPFLSRYADSESQREKVLGIFLKYTAVVGIPISFLGFGFSREIVSFIYGEQYGSAVLPLQILFASVAFEFFGFAFTKPLPAFGKENLYLKYLSIGAGVNVVAGSLLIALFGATGGAVTTLLAELLVAIFSFLYIRTIARLKLLRNLLLSAVGSGLTYLCVLVAQRILHLGFFLGVLVAIVVYLFFLKFTATASLRDFVEPEFISP